MTDTERLIAAFESLGDRIDRLGDKFDVLARAEVARSSNDEARMRAVNQFISDVLHMKEQLDFVAQNTPVRKRKLRVAR